MTSTYAGSNCRRDTHKRVGLLALLWFATAYIACTGGGPIGTPGPAAVPACATGSDVGALTPKVTCVATSGSQRYAVFGYENAAKDTQLVPPGPENLVLPAPGNRGQPARFAAGTADYAFALPITGSSLAWSLGTRRATVASDTPDCAADKVPAGILPTAADIDVAAAIVRTDTSPVNPNSEVDVLGPRVVGSVDASIDVSADGSASLDVRLAVPPGRAGMQPKISLAYSSHGGNGLVGFGFALTGLSTISRCEKTLLEDGEVAPVRYEATDSYCLDGEHLVEVARHFGVQGAAGTVEYRTQHNIYARIIATVSSSGIPDHWVSELKTGQRLTYGIDANSKLAGFRTDPVGHATDEGVDADHSAFVTYSWSVSTIKDRSNNAITFDYELSTPSPFAYSQKPKAIHYTSGNGFAATRSIVFQYEPRPDFHSIFIGGLQIRQTDRLSRVEMHAPTGPSSPEVVVRTYNLAYDSAPSTGRSRLRRVEACDQFNACTPPTTFEWTAGSMDLVDVDTGIDFPKKTDQVTTIGADSTMRVGDLNGDNRDDILIGSTAKTSEVDTRTDWLAYLAQADGSFKGPYATILTDYRPNGDVPAGSPGNRLILADLDSNGVSDIAHYALRDDGTQYGAWRYFFNRATNSSRPLFPGAVPEATELDNAVYRAPVCGGDVCDADAIKPLYVADLDGDYLPEIIRGWTPPGESSSSYWKFRRNNPHAPGTFGSYESFVDAGVALPSTNDVNSYVTELDGTSRKWFLTRNPDPNLSVPRMRAFGLTAGGTVLAHDTSLIVRKQNEAEWRYVFLDVNGDGNVDTLKTTNAHWLEPASTALLALNTGSGAHYLDLSEASTSTAARGLEATTCGVRVMDVNEDGLADVILPYEGTGAYIGNTGLDRPYVTALVSDGDHLEATTIYTTGADGVRRPLPASACDTWPGAPPPTWAAADEMTQVGDVDGDGRTEVVKIVFNAPVGAAALGRVHVLKHQSSRPDTLISVRNGLGLQTTIRYEDVRQDAFTFTGACTYPQHCGIHGLVAVAELDVGDPSDATSFQRTAYDYGSALWDARAEGFLGFTSRTTTNLNTGATTLERFDLATKIGGFHPFLGMPISRETNTRLADGRILATTTTVDYEILHEGDLPASATPFSVAPSTQLERSIERFHGKDVVLAETLTTETHADPFGGLTHRHVAAVHVGDIYDTELVYRNDSTRWLLNLESSIKVTHTAPSGQITRRTKSFEYDSATGLMSVERRAPDEGPELRKVLRYFYNASGLLTDVSESDAEESRLSSNVYDSVEGMFVTARTNALGHVLRTVWQPSWGLPVRVLDPNGGVTDSVYDGFGRLREVTTNAHHHGTTHYTRSLGPITTVSAVDGNGLFAAAYDPLQRLKLKRATGFDGRTIDVTIGYDAAFVDKPAYVARPRFTDESSSALLTTSFQYDLAGRTIAVHEPGGASVVKRYAGLRTTTVDEVGRETFVESDQLGRTARHVALNGFDSGPLGRPTPHEIETRYFYGRFGALEQINDADGNSTTITYDAWGRRIASSDPDTGIGAFEYNAFDELTTTMDGAGSRSTLGHDSLGRLYGETTKDGTTCFAWDTAPHGVGSLAATQSPDGIVTKHAYDGVGRPLATSWIVDGETYTFLNKYDPTANRVATVAYPRVGGADFGLTFDYSANGDVKSVQDVVSHAVVWQAEQRNAALQLERESFANGVVTTRTYDGDRGLLKNIKTQGAGKHGDVLQSLSFDYFADGRVKRRTDTLLASATGRIENYTYDQVGRLTDWQVPSVTESTYTYDDINNLTEIHARSLGGPTATTTESFAIGSAGPHQVTTTSAGSYFYDANGNVVDSPGRSITSTAFNLPRRIEEGGQITTFVYDAFGSRVKKTGPDGTTITIGLFERRITADGATTDLAYIPGANRVVAQVTATSRERTTTFLHDDRLGSPVLLTDGAGKVVERRRFDPFGKSVQPDNPAVAVDESESVSLGFTGQPLDHGLDLVNMGGRIYDPKLRRFLSADPIVQSPTSLGLNPYAYVGNDPVNFIDPTGFAETRAEAADEAAVAGNDTEICFGECVDESGLPVMGKSNSQAARRTSKSFKLDIRLTGSDDASASADRQRRQGPTQPDVFQEMGTTPHEYYANHLGDVCWGICEPMEPGVFEEDAAISSVNALNIAYRNGDVSKYCGSCNGNWNDPFMGPHSPLARASYEAKRRHIEARGMVALADKVIIVASAATAIGAPAAAEAALGAEAAGETAEIPAARAVNGNSRLSLNAQHVYEIIETDVATGSTDVFKYGISGGPLNAAGLSVRAEAQVRVFTRAAGGQFTYESSIVQIIEGGAGARGTALSLERQLVYDYRALTGAKPLGNIRP